ncbi:hypothetical protein NC651_001263 [Populus alba x Populus x berolinensis]|nr:hypothetical protein NC651_001263 [Populus alba x Populus x berolinensis]
MFRHHHSFLRGEEFYLQSSQDDGLFPVALKGLLLPFIQENTRFQQLFV